MKQQKIESVLPQNIVQAYRAANEQAGLTTDYDDKIHAYDKVINFCSGSSSCRLDRSRKRNVLLYWAYNNVADAYVQKNNFEEAINHYEKSLPLARENREKISVLEKLADVYEKMDHKENWLATKARLVEFMPVDEQQEAYRKLAGQSGSEMFKTDWLEKAVQAVSKEGTSVRQKCLDVLEISRQLLEIYRKKNDKPNQNRINDLIEKTSVLLSKSLKH